MSAMTATVTAMAESMLDEVTLQRISSAASRIVAAKERGGKVVVVTGSGPNIHEGVTTLIAELMRVGVIDGVSTSSAVVAHELGGTLDKVKRCPGDSVGLPAHLLPRGGEFELTVMDAPGYEEIARHMPLDWDLIRKLQQAPGKTIIKAAGNLGYPMGLWIERFSGEIRQLAQAHGLAFEEAAGFGADERTMLGRGARMGLPVLVTIPQLVGGGVVGVNVADSITAMERSTRLARMLDSADIVIESAVALTQEVHDGPFERYTGHGLWSAWQGHYSFTLEGKTLIRMDLDPALDEVCRIEREGGGVQAAIAGGHPKTKLFKTPFRMEMSGFARHEGSIPLIGDIGAVWPLLASQVVERLGLELGFMSYPQQTGEGQAMREAIVNEIQPIDRDRMVQALSERASARQGTPA